MDRTFTAASERQARSEYEAVRVQLAGQGWIPVADTVTPLVRRFRPDLVQLTVTFSRFRATVVPTDRPFVAPANRPYGETTCPSCGKELDPLPKKKSGCPHCGLSIYVRSGPDGKRHLLNEAGRLSMQAAWDVRSRDRAEAVVREEIGQRPETPREIHFEVVGESNYQDVLGSLCGGRRDESANHPCVATVTLEPENPYDRNAVRVDVDDKTVGYLSRVSARAFEPVAQVLDGRSLTCPARIVGGWQRGFDFGSFGIIVELPPADDLVERVRRGHVDLTVATS